MSKIHIPFYSISFMSNEHKIRDIKLKICSKFASNILKHKIHLILNLIGIYLYYFFLEIE